MKSRENTSAEFGDEAVTGAEVYPSDEGTSATYGTRLVTSSRPPPAMIRSHIEIAGLCVVQKIARILLSPIIDFRQESVCIRRYL